jgi:hypothetical protein
MASSKKKDLIGNDPLGGYVAGSLVGANPTREASLSLNKQRSEGEIKPTEEEQEEKRVPFSSYLKEGTLQRVRNTVAHLAGPPEFLNLTELTERAMLKEVERLEKKHNEGKPYPPAPSRRRK